MKKALAIVLWSILCLTPPVAALSEPAPADIPVAAYISDVSRQIDVNFTIEADNSDRTHRSQIDVAFMPSTAKASDVDDVVAALRKALPNTDVFRDATYHSVVHLVDRSLNQEPGYPMNGVVPQFKFSGSLYTMASALGKQIGAAIGFPRTLTIDQLEAADFSGTVAVDDTSMSVRSILTGAAMPGTVTGGILWRSSYRLADGKPYTAVYYYVRPQPRK